MRIMKMLKENKWWNHVKNIMTVGQLTYAAYSVDNHELVWLLDVMVQGIEDKEEKRRYKIYKDLDPEETVKYTPQCTLLERILRGNTVWH